MNDRRGKWFPRLDQRRLYNILYSIYQNYVSNIMIYDDDDDALAANRVEEDDVLSRPQIEWDKGRKMMR